jgi:hypothetical protein
MGAVEKRLREELAEPGLLLTAELDQIADAGAGDPGICNGPILLQKSARGGLGATIESQRGNL